MYNMIIVEKDSKVVTYIDHDQLFISFSGGNDNALTLALDLTSLRSLEEALQTRGKLSKEFELDEDVSGLYTVYFYFMHMNIHVDTYIHKGKITQYIVRNDMEQDLSDFILSLNPRILNTFREMLVEEVGKLLNKKIEKKEEEAGDETKV